MSNLLAALFEGKVKLVIVVVDELIEETVTPPVDCKLGE
jgi:hypothetical protein